MRILGYLTLTFAVGGCTVDLSTRAAQLACKADAQCPEGMICATELGRCVEELPHLEPTLSIEAVTPAGDRPRALGLADEPLAIDFVVADANVEDAIDVAFTFSADGGVTWATCTAHGSSGGTSGLSATGGVVHRFLWELYADAGVAGLAGATGDVDGDGVDEVTLLAYAPSVLVRAEPSNPAVGTRGAVQEIDIAVGNGAPSVEVQPLSTGQGAQVPVFVTLRDVEADLLDLGVEYELASDPGVWSVATLLLEPASNTAVPSSEAGSSQLLVWQASVDLGSIGYRGQARLRVSAYDGLLRSAAEDTGSFFLRLNTPPVATVRQDVLASPLIGRASLPLLLADVESDLCQVNVEYRTSPSDAFAPATLTGVFVGLPSSPAGSQRSVTWDTTADVAPQYVGPAEVRVWATDFDVGPTTEILSVDLDNSTVSLPPVLSVAGASALELSPGNFQASFPANGPLSENIVITAADLDIGEVVTLTATFQPIGSNPFTSLPSSINPAPLFVDGVSQVVAPTQAQIVLSPNGNVTPGRMLIDLVAEDAAGQVVTGTLLVRSNVSPDVDPTQASYYGEDTIVWIVPTATAPSGSLSLEASDANPDDPLRITASFDLTGAVGYSTYPSLLTTDPETGSSSGVVSTIAPGVANFFLNASGGLSPGRFSFFLELSDDADSVTHELIVHAVNTFGANVNLTTTLGSGTAPRVHRGRRMTGGASTGRRVATAGDFNGDGLGDFLVSAPDYDVDLGRIYLVYGATNIASNTALNLEALNGTTGVRIDGKTFASSEAGAAIASPGDVNGDGYSDILIGDSSYDSLLGPGRVYLLYGRSGTLASDGTFNLETDMAGDGVVLSGGGSTGLGSAVSGIGDFDGDGYADFAIASYEFGASGRVSVVYGAATIGSGGAFDVANADNLTGASASDCIGQSVAGVGDLNGDGFDDFVVRRDLGANDEASIVLGRASLGDGPLASVDIPVTGLSQNNPGINMAGADINGDGYSDVVIGAHSSSSGSVSIVWGRADFASLTSVPLSTMSASTGVRISGSTGGTGNAVGVAGDVNGDGYADLALGSYDNAPSDDPGAGYLLHGARVLSRNGNFPFSELVKGGGTTFAANIGSDSDLAIAAAGVGDVNGDGVSDFIFGGSLDDSAYLVLGRPTLWPRATYVIHDGAGNQRRRPVGSAGGDSDYSSPWAQASIEWNDGSASTTTVTLIRGTAGITHPGPLASKAWRIDSDRTGFTAVEIILQYADADIAGLTEANLVVQRADSEAGPFTPVTVLTHSQTRNRIRFATGTLGVFVITE